MIAKKMQDALNEQINAELYSAYIYLSMVTYFESINLPGFAQWMKIQAQEETSHAMKIFDFIHERLGRVTLKAIEGPPTEWDSPLAAFEAALKHEQKVTGLINDLVNLAIEQKDHAAKGFLQWFVDEQVEEESSADAIVQKLKMIGDSPQGLLILDGKMAQRTAGE